MPTTYIAMSDTVKKFIVFLRNRSKVDLNANIPSLCQFLQNMTFTAFRKLVKYLDIGGLRWAVKSTQR